MPTLSDIGRRFDPLREFIEQANQELENFGHRLDETRQQATRNAQQIKSVVDALREGMSGIRTDIQALAQSFTQLNTATSRGRQSIQQEAATIEDAWEAFKKMGVQVEKLDLDYDTLKFSQKELNKIVQLGTEYNKDRADSYTALSQKYRAITILLDQMTIKEREGTIVGQQLVAQAREMYEQMNLFQQSKGKFQLQVGNYSKAMNGLQIATNQVVRELPVLANGVSMFAIAISNNIPILVDSIEKTKEDIKAKALLKKELLENAAAYELQGNAAAAAQERERAEAIETTTVWKALGAALKGWQTILVVVLTVLPTFIRNLEKKKKAQKEANEETKDAITLENLLTEAYKERDKEQVRDISRLQTLYSITQDVLRSQEDRIKAAQILKDEYKDEFELLSEQEILLGNAKNAYDKLTESLITQARARAYLNKITALQEQAIDQKAIRDQAKAEKEAADAAVIRAEAEIQRQIELGNTGEGLAFFSTRLAEAQEAQESANSALLRADMPLQDLDNAILQLQKDIPVDGLLGELLNGKSGDKGDKAFKIADYYNEALKSLIDGMQEGLQKSLALLDLEWKKQQETYEAYRQELLRIQKEGNAQEREEATTQLSNLNLALISMERNYIEQRKKLIQEVVESYKASVEDEGDVEEAERKRIATILESDKKLREMAAYEAFEISERSAKDKEDLNNAILASEQRYWNEYLAQLRDAGLLTVEEYNKIMSNLAKAIDKGESGMSRNRKGRRYGGIVEAILAQTSKYGEGNKFGQGILKEEYMNFVSSVDEALKTSMKYMDEWMDKRLEMAEVAVQAAQKEVDATRKYFEYELETRANGYANRVETARKELELARQKHKEALAEEKRLQEQQLAIDTITQASSLVTATANIWEAMTKGTGVLGPALATAATALLWGSFAAAKVKASQLAGLKAEQYGEGTVQLLQGGSHASGNDIDLGTKPDGTRRRAEGGEFLAIINKRSSKKFRSVIPDIINSLNDGTFGERYQRANALMGNYAISLLGGQGSDLSALERDVNAIRNQGQEVRYVDGQGNTIIKYKNLTRKIKS